MDVQIFSLSSAFAWNERIIQFRWYSPLRLQYLLEQNFDLQVYWGRVDKVIN